MAMTDPLGDMLTRIRNGQQAKKDSVLSPASKLRARVLDVLQREGYIRGYTRGDDRASIPALRIELKYFEGQPAIQHRRPRLQAGPPRLFGRAGAAAGAQRPRHHHRLDAQGRSVGRRSARAERRRRSAGGGVLMSRIGKSAGRDARAASPRRSKDGMLIGQGPQGHADACRCATRSATTSRTAASRSSRPTTTKRARAFWGMQRTLVQNLVTGVTEGFTKMLEITGVGYRAAGAGPEAASCSSATATMSTSTVPEGLEVKTPDQTTIEISGIDRRRSASSPPRSAAGASPSPTRARASSIAASTSSAKKARRSSHGRDSTPSTSAASASARRCAAMPATGRGSRSIAPAGTSMRRSSTMPTAAPWPPPRRSEKEARAKTGATVAAAQESASEIAERGQEGRRDHRRVRPRRFPVPWPRQGAGRCRARRRIGVLEMADENNPTPRRPSRRPRRRPSLSRAPPQAAPSGRRRRPAPPSRGRERGGRGGRGGRDGGRGGGRGRRDDRRGGPGGDDDGGEELIEKLVHINRVSKTVKGGKRFGFAALVVVGDGKGRVGFGHGKAREVPEAITKATAAAKKAMVRVPLREGRTLHHDGLGHFGAGKVYVRSAPAGHRHHRRRSDARRVREPGRCRRRHQVDRHFQPLQHDPRDLRGARRTDHRRNRSRSVAARRSPT